MSSWSIDSAGTRAILDEVEVALEEFERSAHEVNGALDELIGAVPDTMTAGALETFGSDPLLIGLTSASEHAYSAVWGTRGAVDAFDAGQLEMVTEIESGLAPRMSP